MAEFIGTILGIIIVLGVCLTALAGLALIFMVIYTLIIAMLKLF